CPAPTLRSRRERCQSGAPRGGRRAHEPAPGGAAARGGHPWHTAPRVAAQPRGRASIARPARNRPRTPAPPDPPPPSPRRPGPATAPPPGPRVIPRGGAHGALAMLVAVFVLGHVDRNILNILIEPIKRELGASDTLMGVLTGPAFALFFAGAGVPIARLADRSSRTRIVLVGLVLWSIVTAAQGAVRALWHLVIARILVGVGEATTSPASHSLIADYYP